MKPNLISTLAITYLDRSKLWTMLLLTSVVVALSPITQWSSAGDAEKDKNAKSTERSARASV